MARLNSSRRADFIGVALTFGTGASDAISFMRLGNVFASVVTGNLALLGVSAARSSGGLAAHAGLALAAFAAGAMVGALALRGRHDDEVPRRATCVLAGETLLWAAFLAVWLTTNAVPLHAGQLCLLAVAAVNMGLQSAAARAIKPLNISTTYLTGTLAQLTWAIGTGERGQHDYRRVLGLVAMLAGAGAAAGLVVSCPLAAPVLPLATTCASAALSYRARPH